MLDVARRQEPNEDLAEVLRRGERVANDLPLLHGAGSREDLQRLDLLLVSHAVKPPLLLHDDIRRRRTRAVIRRERQVYAGGADGQQQRDGESHHL